MSETVTASNGVQLPINDLDQVFAYSGGFPTTCTVAYYNPAAPASTINYVQTFTNNGTNITDVSRWIAQS